MSEGTYCRCPEGMIEIERPIGSSWEKIFQCKSCGAKFFKNSSQEERISALSARLKDAEDKLAEAEKTIRGFREHHCGQIVDREATIQALEAELATAKKDLSLSDEVYQQQKMSIEKFKTCLIEVKRYSLLGISREGSSESKVRSIGLINEVLPSPDASGEGKL